MRRNVLVLLALVLLGSLAFAGGQKDQAAGTKAAEPANLILMHDKGGNPNYQPFYEEVGKKRRKRSVGFTPTPYPTTDVYMASVRAALPTNKAPELFTWWSTYRMKELIDQGLVATSPTSGTSTKTSTPRHPRRVHLQRKAYGFPYTVEYWGVWYNKAVFAKYNLAVPKTWDEFLKSAQR
jgi:multiple sugar transport system substrate-binding protein/raffinose/stachyose/melibiose transport system substrate-binding protein